MRESETATDSPHEAVEFGACEDLEGVEIVGNECINTFCLRGDDGGEGERGKKGGVCWEKVRELESSWRVSRRRGFGA